MYAALDSAFRDTPAGQEAERILRTCVHCGFCLATCPTYQLLGDELDSPRGRIYLMKNMLEGQPVSRLTQRHLDRCLTCRSCESTCPSGVQYGRLVDIGRVEAEARVERPAFDRFKRWALKSVLPRPMLFRPLVAAGRALRPLLPRTLRRKIPAYRPPGAWPEPRHARRMLVLAGCVQPVLAPEINAAAARLLDRLGVSLVTSPGAGCCGAIAHHLADEGGALDAMRRNIDAWWPVIEQGGVEAIVVTASGCGTELKDYGHALRGDPAYSDRAQQISALARDVSEALLQALEAAGPDALERLLAQAPAAPGPVAFHSPCSLQHGQKLKGVVERLLAAAGATLTAVPDPHLCCGSAGTYSLLQKDLSRQLQANKIAALESGRPDLILTANIGCLLHLAAGTDTPVQHWVQWLDARLSGHHQGHAEDRQQHAAQGG
ncbi:MAG: glycolate oxidase subunit GlcF [Betaproteobacteria bacterium]|nr:glycolate oxidase subunit GlcF [Betaproteobacteria bacterium]MDE2131476.1 glycolate oxidase subunit GlcF [Betaproteobacteria bacterium]